MSKKKSNTPEADLTVFNPFEHREADEVWKEIRKNTTATTREEALQAMQSLRKEKTKGGTMQ